MTILSLLLCMTKTVDNPFFYRKVLRITSLHILQTYYFVKVFNRHKQTVAVKNHYKVI